MKKSHAVQLALHYVDEVQDFLKSPELLKSYLFLIGIDAPKAANDEGFYLRLNCVEWWTRRLIRRDLKDREAQCIASGHIARGKEIYCSNQMVKYFKERQENTLAAMDSKMLISDQGEELDMIDVLKASLANPENRRAELMVRMSGFEQHADSQGHIGMFYTLTCPSKYHRFSGDGLNENYQHTPKAGQDYLVKLWAQIRAQFKRDGLIPYGFRVAEPHHDGTPHWHMLLFMPQDQAEQCTDIMRSYAMREDGDENGADLHRFTVKAIVKEIITKEGVKRVSATGYIAKYISKNIGFDIGGDSEDDSKNTSDIADRVRSWASVWGIRQFQQIGGASVTVWRELRRLKDVEIEHDLIRHARDLCIENKWAEFLVVMGGIEATRIEREIQLLKKNTIDTETGEIKVNRYREIVEKIVGICADSIEFVTHVKNWVIVSKARNPHEVRVINQFHAGNEAHEAARRPLAAVGFEADFPLGVL